MRQRKRDSWRISTDTVKTSDKTGFDELVVGEWLHLERMDKNYWWLRIGQNEADIKVSSKGAAKVVWRKP